MVTIHAWDSDVVVRVAIILDEGAARVVHVAGKLDGIRVDLVNRGKEGLALMHNNGAVLVVSGSGKLSITSGANIDVSSNERKVNAVGVLH